MKTKKENGESVTVKSLANIPSVAAQVAVIGELDISQLGAQANGLWEKLNESAREAVRAFGGAMRSVNSAIWTAAQKWADVLHLPSEQLTCVEGLLKLLKLQMEKTGMKRAGVYVSEAKRLGASIYKATLLDADGKAPNTPSAIATRSVLALPEPERNGKLSAAIAAASAKAGHESAAWEAVRDGKPVDTVRVKAGFAPRKGPDKPDAKVNTSTDYFGAITAGGTLALLRVVRSNGVPFAKATHAALTWREKRHKGSPLLIGITGFVKPGESEVAGMSTATEIILTPEEKKK